jgi:hypothetical protein
MATGARFERRTCPRCGERDAVPIVYGLPGTDLGEASDRGDVVLGGCCVSDDLPIWHCNACDHDFGTLGAGDGRRRE